MFILFNSMYVYICMVNRMYVINASQQKKSIKLGVTLYTFLYITHFVITIASD